MIFKGSWLTRLTGIAIIVETISSAVVKLTDNNPLTNVDWKTAAVAIATGYGIAIARQNNVSSQDVGIRPAVTTTNVVERAEMPVK